MSEIDRQKKLESAKKKLKKFQHSKPPVIERSPFTQNLDKEILLGIQNNHIFKTPPLVYNDKKLLADRINNDAGLTKLDFSPAKPTNAENTSSGIFLQSQSLSNSPKSVSPADEASLKHGSGAVLEAGSVKAPVSPGNIEHARATPTSGKGATDPVADLIEVPDADLQQSLVSYKRSNQLLVTQVNEQRRQLLQLQEQLRKDGVPSKPGQEQKALKEQLEVHIQTIGILVQEKSELQSSMASLQKKLAAKEAEINDLNNKLQSLRQRVVELEKTVAGFNESYEKQTKVNKDLVSERDRYSNRLYEICRERDETQLQNSELREKLSSKIQECSHLLHEISELNAKLQKAELIVQQISASSSDAEAIKKWNKEKQDLLRTLDQQKGIVQALVSEKAYLLEKQNDTQDHYDSQIEHLKNKINTLEKREHVLLERAGELEQSVLDLQKQIPVVAVDSQGATKESEAVQAQTLAVANLTSEREALEAELEIQVRENRRLAKHVIELETSVEELKLVVSHFGEQSTDRSTLLEQIQSDKETLSRALQQNKVLKEQLEELQDGFVKMSNTSADLTTKLESEQHGNKDVAVKLSTVQMELEETKSELHSKNSRLEQVEVELKLYREECYGLQQKITSKEMDLDFLSTQLETIKIELAQQVEKNKDLSELGRYSDLSFKLQEELHSAQDTINILTNQNIGLRNALLQENTQQGPQTSSPYYADVRSYSNVYKPATGSAGRDDDDDHASDVADDHDEDDESHRKVYDSADDDSNTDSELYESYGLHGDSSSDVKLDSLQLKLQQLQDERLKILDLLQQEREKSFNATQHIDDHIQLQVQQQLQQKSREIQEHYFQETEALQLRVKSLQEALEIMRRNEKIDEFDVGSDGISMPALKTAFMQLQKRYKEAMDVKANLTESIEELQHKNSQLELETETIGEYIALYQTQRLALKERFAERDKMISNLSNEHARMQNKVLQLHHLVSQLLGQRSGERLTDRQSLHYEDSFSESTVSKPSFAAGTVSDVSSTVSDVLPHGLTDVGASYVDEPAKEQTRRQIMQIFEQLEMTGEGYQRGWLSPAVRRHNFQSCKYCSGNLIFV